MNSKRTSLTETLEIICQKTKNDRISFNDILSALRHRGFGAILIAPCLITILPTGGIPGIPALCGIFIIFVSAQILLGLSQPWIPKKIKNITFSKDKYKRGVEKAKPYTQKVDQLFYPRLQFLTNALAQKIVALLCLLLSIAMVFIGFIPFIPALLSIVILFLALGISTHDGVLVLFGGGLMPIASILVPYLLDIKIF